MKLVFRFAAAFAAVTSPKPTASELLFSVRDAITAKNWLVNDFQQWGKCSPWDKKDPAMKRTMGTTTRGVGATYSWEGNKDIGTGSMAINGSVPSSKINVQLNFLKPFEAQNMAEVLVTLKEGLTEVRWAMRGPQPF
jgi:hypothetical protein